MEGFMDAAVLYAPGDLRYEKTSIPGNIGKGEALIRVKAAGICGSDLPRIMTTGTYSFPTIPGHEFCGEIEEIGGDEIYKKGDRVAVAPILPCFTCDYCQTGNYGQCQNYNYLGSRTNGGFAQYVKAPVRNLIRLPDSVSFFEGAALEPAAVTLHGIKKVGINPGDVVAVLGCGTIGLFAIQFARILGAGTIIAVDIDADKLDLAGKTGADICINPIEMDLFYRINEITEGKGVNVAVETAGVSSTQLQCLKIARKLGRILYLGTAHKDVVINPSLFESIVRNELMITGAWNSYSAPFPGIEWQASIEYMKSGSLKIKPLISHIFKLKEAGTVFKDMVDKKYSYTKVIFDIDNLNK